MMAAQTARLRLNGVADARERRVLALLHEEPPAEFAHHAHVKEPLLASPGVLEGTALRGKQARGDAR